MSVLSVVNIFGLSTKDVYTVGIKFKCKVVRNLSTYRNYCTVRVLQVMDIQYALKCKLVKVQSVAHVVVCRYSLRVVVDHYTSPTAVLDCSKCVYTTPVKLY